MTEAEIRAIVEDAATKAANKAAEQTAEEAVKRTLLTLGISTAEPLEHQKDMQHLREWRLAVSAAKRQGMFTVIAVLVSGTLGAIWWMVKAPAAP
ncbi:hypothetical protein ATER59S_01873 [Aquamicrobium terrae]